jgi:hypothetical protein
MSRSQFWQLRAALLAPHTGGGANQPSLQERIAVWVAQKNAGSHLSLYQKDILDNLLSQLRDNMIKLHGATPETILQKATETQWVNEAIKEYETTMIEAIRIGLADFPLVKEWIETRRVLGEWDVLRRARRGLEKAVRRPLGSVRKKSLMTPELRAYIMKLAPTMNRETVRRRMIEEGRLPENYTKQAFHKLLRTHSLEILFTKLKSQ